MITALCMFIYMSISQYPLFEGINISFKRFTSNEKKSLIFLFFTVETNLWLQEEKDYCWNQLVITGRERSKLDTGCHIMAKFPKLNFLTDQIFYSND